MSVAYIDTRGQDIRALPLPSSFANSTTSSQALRPTTHHNALQSSSLLIPATQFLSNGRPMHVRRDPRLSRRRQPLRRAAPGPHLPLLALPQGSRRAVRGEPDHPDQAGDHHGRGEHEQVR